MPQSSSNEGKSFVFQDRSGKRWRRLRILFAATALALFIGLIGFVQSLFITPQLNLPVSVRQMKGQIKALQRAEKINSSPKKQVWRQFFPSVRTGHRPASMKAGASDSIRLGFYVSWDPNSYRSLVEHASQLTHICPEQFSLTDASGHLESESDSRVESFAAAHGQVLIPLLNNLGGDNWQPEAVEGLTANTPEVRNRFIANLEEQLDEEHAGGVLIDWEMLDPAYKDGVTHLLQDIASTLHRNHQELWLCVPMGQDLKAFDLEDLAPVVDHFVALLSDENSETDLPGPIASQDWFEGWLRTIMGYGDSSQWVIGIGCYGYDWTEGAKKAGTISFVDAMSRAGDAGINSLKLKTPTYNPNFSYNVKNQDHTVWFLDAGTFLNQMRAARDQQVGGLALIRLGTEDPRIWKALKLYDQPALKQSDLDEFSLMQSENVITNVGDGEFLTVDDSHADGWRDLKIDSNGRVIEEYKKIPGYCTLFHQGAGGDHDVALTFDDGPDERWTPQILDILKARGVKAAFFIVGLQAEAHPELLARIVAEGHELGNHTYKHPNLSAASPERARLEINATQLLIESFTGRSTTLFRPPYNADSRPNTAAEIAPLKLAEDMGYLIVCENIDPEDWSRPGADAIVQRVKLLRHLGNIILLHDAGGDRRQTVEALPKIIDYLEARGDRIVPLGQLLGMSRDQLMPILLKNDRSMGRLFTGTGFRLWHAVEDFLWAFMVVATCLIVIRTLVVAALASRHRWSPVDAETVSFHPPLSILIAAYNEAKVIRSTLRSLMDTDYPGRIEVIVVDDGSSDSTREEVQKSVFVDQRIRLISQSNRGKAEALRTALQNAKNDIVVMLDADTHFQRDTLIQLIQPLQDERVGAVSGHAKVGNLRTFIAKCQSLEYICGFNLDRRAYHEWNCITVVPGAISAFRRQAIEEAGGISSDTLAEDTDLTLSLHETGYRIAYVPEAIAWTEAPETVANLAKQRFRWAFGTLQCLWKHADLLFNPSLKALGWFSLPSVWFFQIILVAFAPVIDALLIVSLILGSGSTIFLYFISFLAMDFFLACLACFMEREPMKNAFWIIPMRMIYRPLLSFVIWKAILRATKGALVGWGKLERTASVTTPPLEKTGTP